MSERTLHKVLAEIVDACRRYPALYAHVFHCLFDGGEVRDGLFRVECDAVSRPARGGAQVTLVAKVWPSEWLLQFAHAVSRGVMPEMVLPAADVVVGHKDSRTREEHEATVSGSAFMRIPEFLNTELTR
ncbi:hypothetical protein ACFSHT_15775 [Paraburkholderia silviterrae]|uniref:Uncharacterized protein n=1 Tax=Paraburkholderia silviterrae TaxID=2528715 RepID=A0A4V2ZZ15_9BURK|nr:hypothetical protein [Paraburkholderia silviterrae]TDG23248.1 hypothetical protein EYW47_15060 [Paraburkholderia silviterrae]